MHELSEMFKKQLKLQRQLDEDFDQEYINAMALSLVCEIHEILETTPWKRWKKNQSFNREEYKKEIVDIFCFAINLCLAKGITPKELFEAYIVKNKINKKRIKDKY